MKRTLRTVSLILTITIFLANGISLFSADASSKLHTAFDASRPASERGIVALNQALKDLTNPFIVMAVAASAAEVDYATLAYFRKRLGATTIIALATRDESGEKGAARRFQEETAVINTRRAIAAAQIVDSDLYFLNLPDPGHTKFAEEALTAWGHDVALARLVRAIRLLRPDIIITASNAKKDDGQQQALARLVNEAFDVASDVSRFAEPDTEPWRVSRVFEKADEGADVSTINLAEYDAGFGLTYGQIGRAALKKYRERPGWPERFEAEEEKAFYKLKRSAPDDQFRAGQQMLDALAMPEILTRSIAPPRAGDLTLNEAIGMRDKLIDALKERLIEKRAEGSVADMRSRYGSQFFRMIRYTQALERALAIALGLSLEASLSDRVLIRGQKLWLKLTFRNQGSRALPVVFHKPETLPLSDNKPSYKATEVTIAGAGSVKTEEVEYQVPEDAQLTLPRSAQLYKKSYYAVSSLSAGARDLVPTGAQLLAYAEVQVDQTTLPLPVEVSFDTAPLVEIETIPFALVKDWSKPRDFEFTAILRNRARGPFRCEFWIVPLGLTDDDYKPQTISFLKEDEEISVRVKLGLPVLKPPLSPEILMEVRREKPATPTAIASEKVIVKSGEFEMAEGIRAGYINGFDSWLGFALNQIGVDHAELQIADIKTGTHGAVENNSTQSRPSCADLSRFNTIIIDNLAYFARPDLVTASACLLDYVARGGTLVVLYQQPDDLNLLTARGGFAPYPIKLSKDRVTIESSPVKLLEPEHTILSKPNQITEKDFEGWVRDRAVYVPSEWATEYRALLETSDPGEEPRKGGLLVARHSEGMFVYVTYDLRSQALAMNAGAYRLLANIIGLPVNRQR